MIQAVQDAVSDAPALWDTATGIALTRWTAAVMIFTISFSTCLAVVVARPLHIIHTTRAGDLTSVQAAHRIPTPRVGGVAIFFAVLAVAAVEGNDFSMARAVFLLSLVPVFAAGLAEDLGFGVSPRGRLTAAAISALIAIAGLHVWAQRIDVPGIDALLRFWPVGVAFTVLCSAGFAHAYNLIDGINGFAAALGVLIALAFAVIAIRAGDVLITRLSFLVVPALLGFLVFNWPFGKIFLGDAGAYSLGHVFAWLGIMLANRESEVAAFALALVMFWPVADTLFAIARRRLSGRSAYEPDRMHFHHVVMRGLEVLVLGRTRRKLANSLTTVILLPFASMPILAGVLLWNRPMGALVAFLCFAAAYVLGYTAAVRLIRRAARRQRFRRVRAARSIRRPAEVLRGLPAGAVKTSILSRTVPMPGGPLEVRIEQPAGSAAWGLHITDASGNEVSWSRKYATDEEAWADFASSWDEAAEEPPRALKQGAG